MEITRIGSQASYPGPAEYFTGTVRVDPLFASPDPARGTGAYVTFEPGARTAWHTHPLGQVLHVLTGSGLVQLDGEPVRAIHPGDTVTIEPGARHWHGAAHGNTMVHLALQEADAQGVSAVWLEKVTDEEYGGQ